MNTYVRTRFFWDTLYSIIYIFNFVFSPRGYINQIPKVNSQDERTEQGHFTKWHCWQLQDVYCHGESHTKSAHISISTTLPDSTWYAKTYHRKVSLQFYTQWIMSSRAQEILCNCLEKLTSPWQHCRTKTKLLCGN